MVAWQLIAWNAIKEGFVPLGYGLRRSTGMFTDHLTQG
jgi:hypothetical protein